MNTKPNETSASGLVPADQEALKTIGRHQRRLKWLTGAVIAFWALATVGAVGILVCYTLFIAPKEKQIIADYGMQANARKQTAPPKPLDQTERMLAVNFTMTYVITKGILVMAVSVIILSCGTLATLVLVVINRRVTLQQINHSVAQISEQLKALGSVPRT